MKFKDQLNAISSIRLPLILLIVSCHVVPTVPDNTFSWWMIKLISHEMASVGVPMFFLISGLLFFCNMDSSFGVMQMTRNIYTGGGKIKSRINSIFVPYMLWNLLSYLVKSLIYRTSDFSFVMLFSHVVYFDWNWEPDRFFMYPCDGPLWFMRNLFIICLLSPLVYAFIKYVNRYLGVPILVLVYVCQPNNLNDMGLVSTFCFFTLGSYVGLYRTCLLKQILSKGKLLTIVYAIGIVVDLYLMKTNEWHTLIFRIMIIVGIPVLAYLSYGLPSHYKNMDFPSLSMFIYCAHGIVLIPVVSIIRHSGIEIMAIAFFANCIITVVLCIGLYSLMKYAVPKSISKILMGGRS